EINWARLDLGFGELDKKYQSIFFYKSQTESSAFYLLSFARENELFGDYPAMELAPQQALTDKAIAYSGASKMFKDSPATEPSAWEEKTEGNGQVRYAEEGGYLIVRVDKPKKLSNRFGVLLYAFGYSKNTAFAAMPKIRIITAGKKIRVFNAQKRVINPGVLLEFGKHYLVLKVPLKLLGDPDYVLTALKAFHGNLPIDATGFRKVKLK
ncbi:MAG: hypothetical protein PHR73_07925, partial [Candidatus Omnitrophica bacterium]|nr:hypothetical protein [Candidatus Omnitrophota bacterium]